MDDYGKRILELTSRRTGLQHDLDDEIIMCGLDSLQLIEMATELEKQFDIRIEEELAEMTTFRDLANFCEAHAPRNLNEGRVAS